MCFSYRMQSNSYKLCPRNHVSLGNMLNISPWMTTIYFTIYRSINCFVLPSSSCLPSESQLLYRRLFWGDLPQPKTSQVPHSAALLQPPSCGIGSAHYMSLSWALSSCPVMTKRILIYVIIILLYTICFITLLPLRYKYMLCHVK